MLKLICCIKQVPRVTELPWDPKTGTLKRNLADGMINPACRHALEAALRIKSSFPAEISVISMGPLQSEEVIREALGMGADHGILVSDPRIAGADTLLTSRILAAVIRRCCSDFDLVLCGCQTSDSETAQVGPQLTEELNVPGVTYVDQIDLQGTVLQVQRYSDGFAETYEMNLPAVITVSTQTYHPRYVSMGGLQDAFEIPDIVRISLSDLEIPIKNAAAESPTRIQRVFSTVTQKNNTVMTGSARKIVRELLDTFDDKIGGAMGKDIKEDEEPT